MRRIRRPSASALRARSPAGRRERDRGAPASGASALHPEQREHDRGGPASGAAGEALPERRERGPRAARFIARTREPDTVAPRARR